MSAHLSAWLVTYAVHSSIVLALAIVSAKAIRRAAVRDAICRIALVAPLVTATAQVFLPALPRPQLATLVVQQPAVTQRETARSVEPATTTPPRVSERANFVPSWPLIATSLWLTIASLLVARLLLRRRQLLGSFGRRREAVAGDDLVLLNVLRERARVTFPVRLTTSDAISSPLALSSNEIVVPAELFTTLSTDQKEAILGHELAHLTRRDPLWLMIAESVKAVFFFQPLTTLVQKEMRASAEFLCDDFALLHTGKEEALAETLAHMASRLAIGDRRLPIAAMAESSSKLVERVSRVLAVDRHREMTLRTPLVAAIAIIVAGALTAFAPGVNARPVAPQAARAVAAEGASTAREISVEDASLSQTDEVSRTTLEAHQVRMKQDASEISFLKDSGSLQVVQERFGHERHVIHVRPVKGGRVQYEHRVDGVSRGFDDESRAIIADAFRRQSHVFQSMTRERKHARPATEGGASWSGTQEIAGLSDGVPFSYSIRGKSIRFDGDRVAEIYDGGSLRITEEVNDRRRAASFSGSGTDVRIHYAGDWKGASDEERAAWLAHYLAGRSGGSVGMFHWGR